VHEVWARFADDARGLAAAVDVIASAAGDTDASYPDDDEVGKVEGRLVFRRHRLRERDPEMTRRKKAEVLRTTGRLACEACGFDFAAAYGELGDGFIECHHLLALASGDERVTTTADLALVCSNCHRMIHRAQPMLSPADLRQRGLDVS
jgi:5-methylcytosine-specific restriction protein A